MRYGSHWLSAHHFDSASLAQHWVGTTELLKSMWLGALIAVLGVIALITAVILAYPVMAHVAAKFFQ